MLNYIARSLINILKSKGPKTDHCGHTEKTSKGKEIYI